MSENTEVVEREGTEAENAHQPEQPDVEREAVETEARRQGWRPKDEFNGSGTWVDAPEFVERGKQFQSILKRENRELRDQLKEMETRQRETGDVIKQFREQTQQREARAYERGKRDLQAQMDAAVAAGDADGYRRSQQQMQELEREHQPEQREKPAASPPAPAAETPKVDPYIEKWGRENPWMVTDPDANQFAQAVHARLLRELPDLTLPENLAEVRRTVAKRFPEHFGNPRREAPASVNRPTGGNTRQPKKEKGYDDLPADAKAACDRFVKQGLFENREAYCKNYDWSAAQ